MFEELNLFCEALGLPGLFLLSLLASTLVPIGSEWLLAALVSQAGSLPRVALIVVVAGLGNTLGGLVGYALGRGGVGATRVDMVKKRPRLKGVLERWGGPACFLAFLPWVGDPLTVAAGILRVPLIGFLLWSASGRFLRYMAVAAFFV